MDVFTHSVVVDQICVPLAQQLCDVYHGAPEAPHLVFPDLRVAAGATLVRPRVSEQESRILLCRLLESQHRYYSIETPTRQTFTFQPTPSGVPATPPRMLSARTDVTVHRDRAGKEPVLAVELKAHVPPVLSIKKDFMKLAVEGVRGLWFHTLENTNSATMPRLRATMARAWDQLYADRVTGEGQPIEITYAICVLKTRRLHTGLLTFDPKSGDSAAELFSAGTGTRPGPWSELSV